MGSQLYSKAAGLVEKKIGDELVIVPMTTAVAQMNKVFSVNELGSFIMEHLNTPMCIEEIVNLVTDEFDVSDRVAKSDIELFLSHAVAAKVIEIRNKGNC